MSGMGHVIADIRRQHAGQVWTLDFGRNWSFHFTFRFWLRLFLRFPLNSDGSWDNSIACSLILNRHIQCVTLTFRKTNRMIEIIGWFTWKFSFFVSISMSPSAFSRCTEFKNNILGSFAPEISSTFRSPPFPLLLFVHTGQYQPPIKCQFEIQWMTSMTYLTKAPFLKHPNYFPFFLLLFLLVLWLLSFECQSNNLQKFAVVSVCVSASLSLCLFCQKSNLLSLIFSLQTPIQYCFDWNECRTKTFLEREPNQKWGFRNLSEWKGKEQEKGNRNQVERGLNEKESIK
jgi:hypothetical protein